MRKDLEQLSEDLEGLPTYEFLVNKLPELTDEEINKVIDHFSLIDHSGQYLASGARYLHAVDSEGFRRHVDRMVALVIDRDREHRYLADLLTAIYGEDYTDHVAELSANDDNFRRLYKRLYPEGAL
ncbi:MAG: hypothetical protein J1F20_06110 [Muribaculaceae bacterium]|nr:hypothetical protein [Muribaculaceae bacterium]